MVPKLLVPDALAAVLRSEIFRPPDPSRRPSRPDTSSASDFDQNVSWPSSVETACCCVSGCFATQSMSAWSCSGSLVCVLVKMDQIRAVRSQLPLTSTPPLGAKARDETGPSCPDSWSRSCPVCTDQMWMSNESRDPAATTSPLGSTAMHENESLVGAVKVLKLRYRMRSHARMDPSKLEVKRTFPFLANSQPVTPLVCSVKVTMQKPDSISHTLILPSSAVVMMRWPSGE